MIGPPGLRMPRVLIFGLSTMTRSKLCEHQAWLRHCTGDGRAYVRMLVAPPSGVRPPYPDAAPVDNLFKVLSSFSSFGISQHHVVRDLGGSMRRHVSFYRRMTRPHVQPSDLEHTTSPRLSVKVQARKADEHAKIARASQPVSCVGNTRVALFMNPLGSWGSCGRNCLGAGGMAVAGAQNKSKALTGKDILQSIAAPLRDGPYSVLFRCFVERCFVRIVIRRINRLGFAPLGVCVLACDPRALTPPTASAECAPDSSRCERTRA